MSAATLRKVPERCLWAAVLACTVYQSYRYPLQLNSRGTSPTYSDTPMAFQLGKFLIVLPICMVAACYLMRRLLPFREWVMGLLILSMCTFPLVKLIVGGKIEVAYLDVAFWPLAAVIIALCTRGISVKALDRYIFFVFIYGVASELIEVVLFLTIGRLPALAYAGTFSIRFGGFLDDPNASPALWFMLMGWAYYRFTGLKRVLAEVALVLCVLLAQSFTAYGFLVLLALIVVTTYLIRKPNPAVIIGCVLFLSLAVARLWAPLSAVYTVLVQERLGSVDQHLSQVTGTNTDLGLDWLFGLPSYKPYESWWVGSIVNFGVPWYVLSLAVVLMLGLSSLRTFLRSPGGRHKAVSCGLCLLSCYFILGNANLPMFILFPVNVLFFLFTLLVFFRRIEAEPVEENEALPHLNPAIVGP